MLAAGRNEPKRHGESMDRKALIAHCLAYEGALEDEPFATVNATVMRHEGNGKWFALICELDGALCVNLKCEPMLALFLRTTYPGVRPAWHMNKLHWNTVEVNAGVPPEDLCEMISDSYRLTTSPARAERSTRRAKQRPQP